MDGSEFVVSRTAHKNNKSDYYINDKKSNFTEVTDLLKGKGIDLDNNRFLILQGEVEQISMMKPKGQTEHETGLLEYLEDIIGTDKYIEDIDEAGKSLETLNETRQGMVNRLKIAERERDGLEAEKRAAEAFLEKEVECLESKRILSMKFMEEGSENVNKLAENIASLEEKLVLEKEKCKEYTQELDAYEKKYSAADDSLAAVKKDLEDATLEFKEFERKDIKYREDIKHLKVKLKKVEDKAAKDMKKAENAESDAQKIRFELPNLEKRVEDVAKRIGPVEDKLESMVAATQGETEELLGKLREVRAELAPWEKEMTDVKSRIDVAQSEIDMLVKSNQSAVDKYEEACSTLKDSRHAAETKTKEVKEMIEKIHHLKEKLCASMSDEATAIEEMKKTDALAREVRGRAEQRKADASQRATHSAAMTALMKARDSGSIPGIKGRLGDLGAIDALYDVAVSTACPPLDYVVVETTTAAQRCVELLRSQKLGVATFLILEKQAHLKRFLTENVQTPENVPRLFDLVKCNGEDIKLAFYFALRDTLVADNLEQASRIAYSGNKRWRRVVTKKGEMINENGTMSGGGSKPRGGRMCLGDKPSAAAVDPKQAAAEARMAEQELEDIFQRVKEARSRVSEITTRVKSAKVELSDLETAISKTKMDAEAAANTVTDLEALVPSLKDATQVCIRHVVFLTLGAF